MKETYLPIEGYDNYEMSNLGNIRSLVKKKPVILKQRKAGHNTYVNMIRNGKKDFVNVKDIKTYDPTPKRSQEEINKAVIEYRTQCCNSEWGVKGRVNYRCRKCNKDVTLEIIYLVECLDG